MLSKRAIAWVAAGSLLLGALAVLATWGYDSFLSDDSPGPEAEGAPAISMTVFSELFPGIEEADPSLVLRGRSMREMLPMISRTAVAYDGLPSLVDPDFIAAKDVPELFRDEEQVVGVVINGDARAYPIDILSRHETINDTVGGRPVLITWCPLVYLAVVFDRAPDNEPLTFGVTGYLILNNLVMLDYETNSWWLQLAGGALKGEKAGTVLDRIPHTQTTWGRWKELYPESLVLDENLGYQWDPCYNYYDSSWTAGGRGVKDDRLYRKEYVLGLYVNEQPKAYAFTDLKAHPVVNDTVGGEELVVTFDRVTETSGGAFSREVDGRVLTFDVAETPPETNPVMLDRETGSRWLALTGEAVDGPLKGAKLRPMDSNYAFWFFWNDWHPDSPIYLPDDAS